MKKALLMMMLIGSVARAQGTPSLAAEFDGHNPKTNHMYNISQLANKMWVLEETAPCPSYPCSPADHTTSKKFMPVLTSDARMADGNTEISLSENYKITFMNYGMTPPNADGTRNESYWKLTILKNGAVQEEIKLTLRAHVITN